MTKPGAHYPVDGAVYVMAADKTVFSARKQCINSLISFAKVFFPLQILMFKSSVIFSLTSGTVKKSVIIDKILKIKLIHSVEVSFRTQGHERQKE